MLKVRVIPCLDVKDGRVVKGVQFVSLRDAGDPVEQARAYDAAGADELMFLDITASHEKRGIILDVVANTADVENRNLISACADAFGSQATVVAIDAKRADGQWRVFTYGGRNDTGLD